MRLLTSIWIAAASAALCASVSAARPQAPPGLTLALEVDEANLLPFAPLSATARLANVGTAAVPLEPLDTRLDSTFTGVQLLVGVEGGAPRLVRFEFLSQLIVCKFASPPRPFGPGEVFSVPFLLSWGRSQEIRVNERGGLQMRDARSAPVFPSPGVYVVKAVLIHPTSFPNDDTYWVVESNPVTVTVSSPAGVDKAAYEFIRDNGPAGSFGLDVGRQGGEGIHRTITLLPELLERFPTSTYAKYAVMSLANLYFRGAAVSGELSPGTGIPNWLNALGSYYRRKGWAEGFEVPFDATTALLLQRLGDLVNRNDRFFRPGVILLYADALVAKNRKAEALVALNTFLKEYPGSPLAPKAQELLQKISG